MAKLLLGSVVALGLLVGCAGSQPRAPDAASTKPAPVVEFGRALDARSNRVLQAGAQPGQLQIVSLDVYQLTVPHGAVSRSEEFWKRVDEQKVDVATYDLLLKNGLRVGVAPSAEWEYFKAIIDQYPATSQRSAIAGQEDSASLQVPVRKDIAAQDIFYLTDANELYGRSYEQCENLLSVSFRPAPRKDLVARVTVCPLVRTLRKRYKINVLNNKEREIEYVSPERLYDLNLEADVPVDNFLVIGTSTAARWPTSLGNTFLTKDGEAERFEQVLLLVPRVAMLAEDGPDDL